MRGAFAAHSIKAIEADHAAVLLKFHGAAAFLTWNAFITRVT